MGIGRYFLPIFLLRYPPQVITASLDEGLGIMRQESEYEGWIPFLRLSELMKVCTCKITALDVLFFQAFT